MRRTKVKTVEEDVLPRELQRSAPRDVTLNSSGWVTAACALLLIAGGLAGGFLLTQESKERAAMAEELRNRGVTTDAEVTAVRRRRGDEPSVTVSYRFFADGKEFAGGTRLGRRDPLWTSAKPGMRVGVRYLPGTPEHSWLAGYGPRPMPIWVGPLVQAICVPLGVLILGVLRYQRRLLGEGRAAMAVVTKAEKKSDNWRLEYTWRLPSGSLRSGKVDRSSQPAGVGSFVPLVYDRDNPERHAVYPLSLVKVRY